MRIQIAVPLVVLTVALGACAHGHPTGRPHALPQDLVGCYELHATKALYFAPPRLRLNADTISRQTRLFLRDSTLDARTISRLKSDGRPMEARGLGVLYWWRKPASDSVGVMIHTGHSGTELTVHPSASADTLRGDATEHWDFGPPFSNPGGPVSLVRVPCLVEPGSR
jgi:hypothetical protein